MSSPEPWSASRAAGIVAEHKHLEGATLPILHALQEEFGYVDEAAVPIIADALNLSRAEVHGCITFYHDFRKAPAGRQQVKLCRAEACQAMGSDRLHGEILQRLGIDWHGTTADGEVTVEPVYCLGLCSNGPAAMIGEEPLARLSVDSLDAALKESRA
ncbi:formate dehydrogenase subunit gamma [Methylobacterium haplocladii]|uniref:NADH-quinone oxidoreductase subunit E n=1 Tax=Methylobacterium haplocladii TaxID=1176176 RepID=A0A512IT30_9HYPH|nr:formate dehydrogenase subunit gamma [Methylobacterium haplocladii]GEP00865.1 NADH-quinone oxidoreductase subunit E [Methylobacterium haplocladii]GJD86154.1 NADH-quinone oxidoreductase subunit E [Methylobacterium haplocladii]GLS60912.1 NADH-quinone oxidoreductase subunit E [Methylobacterium haplocladii]